MELQYLSAIDVMGLAYLYDLTEKGSSLHEKAKKALDMLAFFPCGKRA